MKKIVIPCIIALFSSACTTTNYLTEQEITSRYESVSALQQALTMAESSNLKMLSPKAYNKANEAMSEAMEDAKLGKKSATKQAEKGLQALEMAKSNGEKSRDMLESVIEARQKAEQVGAQNYTKEAYNEADKKFVSLAKAIEAGDYERVREDRGELASTYRNLELKAMKQDIVESAQKSIDDAKKMGARKHAPKTFKQAEEEMRLALNILEVNRGDKKEAENYAERARWWAERATSVSETVKTFKQGDYTNEDIVLWYQDQFASVMAPVNQSLPLNYDHKRLMASVRSDLEGVVGTKQQMAAENKMLMAQSESLATAGRQQQEEMQTKLTQTREEAKEADRKFALIQSLFNEKEALVFRQQNAVLLRTQGFDFPSGKSEIDSSNFALLQKIIRAIDEYPTAKIAVSGHTDSVGDAQFNLKLSENRAQKVAEFLVKVGQIDPSRVTSKGHGESRPIATNETQDGRAENRRVEITLIN